MAMRVHSHRGGGIKTSRHSQAALTTGHHTRHSSYSDTSDRGVALRDACLATLFCQQVQVSAQLPRAAVGMSSELRTAFDAASDRFSALNT